MKAARKSNLFTHQRSCGLSRLSGHQSLPQELSVTIKGYQILRHAYRVLDAILRFDNSFILTPILSPGSIFELFTFGETKRSCIRLCDDPPIVIFLNRGNMFEEK